MAHHGCTHVLISTYFWLYFFHTQAGLETSIRCWIRWKSYRGSSHTSLFAKESVGELSTQNVTYVFTYIGIYIYIPTLKLTARAPENWWFLIFTDNFLLGWSIFRGYLNLREYTYMIKDKSNSKIQRCSASPYALQRKKSNKFFTENSHQISLIARPPGARFLLDTNYRDPEGVGTCRFLSQKFRGLPYTPKV